MSVALLTLAIVFAAAAVSSFSMELASSRAIDQRLSQFVSRSGSAVAKKPLGSKLGFWFEASLQLGQIIERVVGKRSSRGSLFAIVCAEEKTIRELKLAGLNERLTYEQYMKILVGSTFISGLVGLLMVFLFGKASIFVFVVLLFVGIKLPQLKFLGLARERSRDARHAMLEAVDLLAIGVGSGMSLDRLLRDYGRAFDNVLAEEIEKAFANIDVGKPRREALFDLADRMDLDELRIFVASVLQAEKLGTPLAQVLADQARAIKVGYREKMKEAATKAPVKMLFPLVGLVLPSLFIVLLGPIALKFCC